MCRPPQCPSPFPRATVNADQEPWDYERFLETCNGFATARGSWYYEADGRTAEELRERYHITGPRGNFRTSARSRKGCSSGTRG
jgi:hypothetical protein